MALVTRKPRPTTEAVKEVGRTSLVTKPQAAGTGLPATGAGTGSGAGNVTTPPAAQTPAAPNSIGQRRRGRLRTALTIPRGEGGNFLRDFGREAGRRARNIGGKLAGAVSGFAEATGLAGVGRAAGQQIGQYIEPLRRFSPSGETVAIEEGPTFSESVAAETAGSLPGQAGKFFGEREGFKLASPGMVPRAAREVTATATPEGTQVEGAEGIEVGPGQYYIRAGEEQISNIPGVRSTQAPPSRGRPAATPRAAGMIRGGRVTPEQRADFIRRTYTDKLGPGGGRTKEGVRRIQTERTRRADRLQRDRLQAELSKARIEAPVRAATATAAGKAAAAQAQPTVRTLPGGAQVVTTGGKSEVVQGNYTRVNEPVEFNRQGYPTKFRTGTINTTTGETQWDDQEGGGGMIQAQRRPAAAARPGGLLASPPSNVTENTIAQYMQRYPGRSRQEIIAALQAQSLQPAA